jgi:hypothetical protein
VSPECLDECEGESPRDRASHARRGYAFGETPRRKRAGVAETTLRKHYGRFVQTSVADGLELEKIDRGCPDVDPEFAPVWTPFGDTSRSVVPYPALRDPARAEQRAANPFVSGRPWIGGFWPPVSNEAESDGGRGE